MEIRILGRDLEVSEIGFGCMGMSHAYGTVSTQKEAEELIEKAKNKGIKIIMDLVINHSSDEHAWFQEALKDPNSPYHDYYIFKSSKDGKEPNNWRSVFGGSVWQKVEGRIGDYFHDFTKKLPDL